MYARIERKECDQLLELVIYHSKKEAAEGCMGPHGPLLVLDLTNEQIGELMVIQKIKVVTVDGERVPLSKE